MHLLKKYWFSICSILMIGIPGFFLYKSGIGYYINPSSYVSRVVGESIAYAFFLMLFSRNYLRKWLNLDKLKSWTLCFAVSFSLTAIPNSIATIKEVKLFNNSKRELIYLYENFMNGSSCSHPENQYSKEEYGDFSDILSILKEIFDFSNNFMTELAPLQKNLEGILLPRNLCNEGQLVEAKYKIKQYSDKLDECEKNRKETLDQFELKIKKLDLKGNLKREFLSGFEEGKVKGDKLWREYFDIQKETTEILHNLFDFLIPRQNMFWQGDNSLIFEKEEDVVKYNAFLQSLQEQVQKENSILKKIQKIYLSNFEKIKDI